MTDRMIHDPNARLDYTWDWSTWLTDGETIASHTVTAPTGIIVDTSTADTTTVTAWVKCEDNVDHPRSYRLACHVVTTTGRQDDRSHSIVVDHR